MKVSEGDFIFELKFLAIHPQTHNIQTDVFLQVSHQEQAYQEIIDLLSIAQLEECLEAMKNLLEKGEEYSSEFEQSRLAVLLEKLEDELNDSSGLYWIDLKELDISNASPLILKLKKELGNDETVYEKVVYKNWEIL